MESPVAGAAPVALTRRGSIGTALRVLAVVALFGSSLGAGTSAAAGAHGSVPDLTEQLLALQARWQTADPGERASALAALTRVAAARQGQLAALIADHPEAVLRHALAGDVRASLPRAARDYVEAEETVEGDLEVLHEDGPAGSRYLYFLRRPAGRLALHFAASAPALQTGDRVRVWGVRVKEAMALGSGASDLTVVAAALPNTFGAQRTLVILVNFQDKPSQTWVTPAEAREVVFGSGASSVSNFYLEGSYQQTWLTGDVAGVYTIAVNSTACLTSSIASQAQQAASAAGVTLSSYNRFVYAFPSNSGCGWWGLGTVGGNPSQAWINGSFQNGVVAHEMGHNLGLYHSHALECGASTIGTGCTTIEYGDTLDVMGTSSPPMHFNAVQKELLGWLNYGGSPPITTVQTSGVYTIDPYEPPGSAPKALKVRTPTGDWYYVEFRQPWGFDASVVSGSANVKNGVVLHLWSQQSPNGIYLLDATPQTSSWQDPALGTTSTFSDAAAGITIAPVWTDGTAGVSVTVGGPGCVRGSPTVTVTPGLQQAPAGTAVSYTLSVTNKDQGCASAAFAPTVVAPGGWTATFSTPSISLAPGATGSLTMQLKSATAAVPGLYTVSPVLANTAQPAYSGSAPARYQVSSTGVETTFTDNFERPDAGALGNGWTQVSGTLSLQAGQARSGPVRTMHAAVQAGLVGATQSAAARFAPTGSIIGARFGLMVRVKDAQNYYACYQQGGLKGALRISRFANGVETVLNNGVGTSPRKETFFTMGCRVQGTALTLTVNGSPMLTASDTALASGSVGLFMGNPPGWGTAASSHRADNFSASVQ